MEGPQFSTLAESHLYRSWGCDVIGMTNMPEAKLAREAEISYATIAMVTDYDSWHHEHAPVDVKEVIRVMHENRERVQQLLLRLVRDFPREHEMCPIGSDRALEFAIMTAPEKRDPALLKKLDAVAGRVLAPDRARKRLVPPLYDDPTTLSARGTQCAGRMPNHGPAAGGDAAARHLTTRCFWQPLAGTGVDEIRAS